MRVHHHRIAAGKNDAVAGQVAGRLFALSKGFNGLKKFFNNNINRLINGFTAPDHSRPGEEDGTETIF
jgi:hypothetical protein